MCEMGVPAFFRWLSRKYPSIVVHCVEQKVGEMNYQKRHVGGAFVVEFSCTCIFVGVLSIKTQKHGF